MAVLAGGRYAFPSRLAIGIAATFIVTAIAIALRLHGIARPADYDEGVYWESLRSMAAGHALYRDVYYSQPPLFLVLTYPFYVALGHSLVAARIAIVLASLGGLWGMWLLAKDICGRTGAMVALALLAVNVPYLAQSQALHAEIPATALSIAAVVFSLRQGRGNAAVAGVLLAAAILTKLLVIGAAAPFVLLLLQRRKTLAEAILCASGFAACFVLVLAFFAHDLPVLFRQVFVLHTAAATVYRGERLHYAAMIAGSLRTPMLVSAALGFVVARLRKNPNALPLAGWFVATVLSLYLVAPLWDHHLLILFPPLIALTCFAFDFDLKQPSIATLRTAALVFVALQFVVCGIHVSRYLKQTAIATAASSKIELIARDVGAIPKDEYVITDLQSVAAQAHRDTPPWLVDTSQVRIRAGEITSQTLISQAAQSNVGAVLFASGRFAMPQLSQFRSWVRKHYRLSRRYGPGAELWLRAPIRGRAES